MDRPLGGPGAPPANARTAAWIPLPTTLANAAELAAIAEGSQCDRDAALGRLVRFWSWADAATTDGDLPGMTVKRLAELLGTAERFFHALVAIGWLEVHQWGLRIPAWSERFSAVAKARAGEAQRKRLQRAKPQPATDDAVKHPGDDAAESEAATQPPPAQPLLALPPVDPEAALAPAIERLTRAWNALRVVPPIRKWTEARRDNLRVRLRDPAWLDQALDVVAMIPRTPFLCGCNNRGWRATIDWLLRRDSVTRALEGAYDGKSRQIHRCADPGHRHPDDWS